MNTTAAFKPEVSTHVNEKLTDVTEAQAGDPVKLKYRKRVLFFSFCIEYFFTVPTIAVGITKKQQQRKTIITL